MIKIVKIMTQNVTCNIDLFFNFATEKIQKFYLWK